MVDQDADTLHVPPPVPAAGDEPRRRGHAYGADADAAMTDQLQVLQERTSPGSLPDPFPGYTGIFTYEVDNTQAGQVIVGGGVNSVTWTLEHSGLFVERIRCCAAIIY